MARLTKQNTLASAMRIAGQQFAAKRYEDAQIGEISRLARCSPSTIYQAFGDKTSLFLEATARLLSERFEAVFAVPDGVAGLAALFRILTQHTAYVLDRDISGAYAAIIGERIAAKAGFAQQHRERRERLLAVLRIEYAKALTAREVSERRRDFAIDHMLAVIAHRALVFAWLFGEGTCGTAEQIALQAISPFLTARGQAEWNRHTA